jgi:LAS superfamily LD-carboxypeptidase LdcB
MPENPDFSLEELTGRTSAHVREVPGSGCVLHREVVTPFLALRAAAAADGIELVAVSSFRDFDRQLGIWNGKYRGQRPMQDRAGRTVDALALPPDQRVAAILWWSALPGASRHHWGTDFDCIDANALAAGYKPQLVPAEYAPGGPFASLAAWLDVRMHAFGFYRPYTTDRGGVQPEPWHLSYAPVAARAERALSTARLREVLATAEIDGKAEVLATLDSVVANYVVNVDGAPEAALLSPRLA